MYVELPEVGKTLGKGDAFGVVESVKVGGAVCVRAYVAWRGGGGGGGCVGGKHAAGGICGAQPSSPRASACMHAHASPTRAPPATHPQAASDVYAPVSGEVLEVNELLSDKPATVGFWGGDVACGHD